MAAKTRTSQTFNGQTDSRKVLEQYVLGTSQFMEIPVDKLKVDMSYQREQAESLVTTIVTRFDLNKFEAPTVNIRPDHSHFVVDGGHRVEAARRLGMSTLTCRIVHVGEEDEPGLFIELNRQRRWVTPVQTFKAEVANGNPSSIEIERCLSDRGLRVASSRSPQTVSCTGTLHKVYARRGTVGLCKVLDAALIWPEDEPRRFAGQLLQGLDLFIHELPKNEDNKRPIKNVDQARLRDRLSRTATGLILSRASNRWHSWRALDQRGGSLVDATAEEIRKQYLKR
jgi:Family of unknown function (DUF6551)